jgi:plastocyanin
MRRILFFMLFIVLAGSGHAGQPEEPFVVPVDEEGSQSVEVVGGDYYFRPRHIVVKVQVPVRLLVRTEGALTVHDIVMSEPEAGVEFARDLSKEPTEISFTPTKTGTYFFYCGKKFLFFPSHREKGMEGVLEVVE